MKRVFVIILITLISITSCKKEAEKKALDNGLNIRSFVSEKNGTGLRSAPDMSGRELAQLPYREQVTIIRYSDKDSIQGEVKAPWAFVRFNELEGWVFSGYLKGVNTGNYLDLDMKRLINDASAKYQKEIKNEDGEAKTVNTPDQVKISEVNGSYCVVDYIVAEEACFEPGEDYGHALWYYKDGKWNDFDILKKIKRDVCAELTNIDLVYLNNDEFIDLVVFIEINDGSITQVYLNDGKTLNLIYDTYEVTQGESLIISKKTCGMTIEIHDSDEKGEYRSKQVKFNCRTNRFE